MKGDHPNTLRRSLAPDDATVLNNYSGRYRAEDWTASYWIVTEQGQLVHRQVLVQLPAGFSAACLPVAPGQAGCVRTVRRWGFSCYPEILNEIGFDFTPLLSNSAGDGEWLAHYFQVVTFDLPGYFVIASPSHPFLLYDPGGRLKGSHVNWCTQLGALVYLISGRNFGLVGLQVDDQALYQEALGYALDAIHR